MKTAVTTSSLNIHTNIQKWIHAHIHAQMHAYLATYIHTYIHTHIHTHIPILTTLASHLCTSTSDSDSHLVLCLNTALWKVAVASLTLLADMLLIIMLHSHEQTERGLASLSSQGYKLRSRLVTSPHTEKGYDPQEMYIKLHLLF